MFRLCRILLPVVALLGVSASAHAVPTDGVGPAAPAVAPSTWASKKKPPRPRSLLWATVNVCDTRAAPDTIGIRGSMPGSGNRRERMYMRFEVQYLDGADGRWKAIGPSGDSGWISVGSGRYRARQSGRNFVVRPPQEGSFRLRGNVTFEWRHGDDVLRRASRRTTGGHPGTRGADPRRHSAAVCVVTA
jgi:hypothetical protein